MKNHNIAILAGDGIGPEVMHHALRIFKTIDRQKRFTLSFGDIGGTAHDKYGSHYPKETQTLCENACAVLFGSVGGPVEESHLAKWKDCEKNSILALRKHLKLGVNFRPSMLFPSLASISPLKESIVTNGVDMLIVRELEGDIYFGEHKQYRENNLDCAMDTCEYNEYQIAFAAHHAFKAARKRKGKVTSVDKANVLATSRLWRHTVNSVAKDYPDVKLEHMLVDNCALQLFLNPGQFDVIVTSNLFGDILSDAASAIPGSLGLMPSASFSKSGFGLYEPAGGSAPLLAGKDLANPIAQILSLSMMMRFSLNLQKEAEHIESAVKKSLEKGYRTEDIFSDGCKKVGTEKMTDIIIDHLLDS